MTGLRSDDTPNSAVGKELLSKLRGGDYAHPGESEAVHMALSCWPKDLSNRLLDAGCGRGGTAAEIHKGGWGQVTGIDVDAASVVEARHRYPEVSFHVADLTELPDSAEGLGGLFDGITMFNVLYALAPQRQVLKQLRTLSNPGARLMLFDYTVPASGGLSKAQLDSLTIWHPLPRDDLPGLLEGTGWQVESVKEVTADYARWYTDLCGRIKQLRQEVTDGKAAYPEELLKMYEEIYGGLLKGAQDGTIGAVILQARAA